MNIITKILHGANPAINYYSARNNNVKTIPKKPPTFFNNTNKTKPSFLPNLFGKPLLLGVLGITGILAITDSKYALHSAVANGQTDIVRLFIENGRDINDRNPRTGQTLLHLAAANGHQEILELLCTRGAHINTQDNEGRTPLHFASSNGHEAVVRSLIANRANIDVQDNDGRTPSDIAFQNGHIGTGRVLLAASY